MANLLQILTLIAVISASSGIRAVHFKKIMVNESDFEEKFHEIGIVRQKLLSEVVCGVRCLNKANECNNSFFLTMVFTSLDIENPMDYSDSTVALYVIKVEEREIKH
jgi:hypothetical protein